nr:PilZ domain-containing protein [Candidatus Omnitrophota bacterium]
MYLAYTIILLVLISILVITLIEEIMARKGMTQGIANKYWVLREKRRFVRFQEDLKIRYDRIGSELNPGNTKMRNVSRKGLCISTYEKLKKKDNLKIEIEVPGFSKPVKLIGSVMWVRELRSTDDNGRRLFYTGIRFGKIDPAAEAMLITHLNTLKRY